MIFIQSVFIGRLLEAKGLYTKTVFYSLMITHKLVWNYDEHRWELHVWCTEMPDENYVTKFEDVNHSSRAGYLEGNINEKRVCSFPFIEDGIDILLDPYGDENDSDREQ